MIEDSENKGCISITIWFKSYKQNLKFGGVYNDVMFVMNVWPMEDKIPVIRLAPTSIHCIHIHCIELPILALWGTCYYVHIKTNVHFNTCTYAI